MPRLHRGDTQITRIHRGSTLITRIHRGSDLVYSPGEFMFAYSTGTDNMDRTYTMCVMDPDNPGDARSLYTFSLSGNWQILGGCRIADNVYFSAIDSIYRVPRTGSGSVTPTDVADYPSDITSVQGVWPKNGDIAVSGPRANTNNGNIYTASLATTPFSWTLESSYNTGSSSLQTGNNTWMWALRAQRSMQRFIAFSGSGNTPSASFTTILFENTGTSDQPLQGFAWWNNSLWYTGPDATLYRVDNVDGAAEQFRESQVGSIAVDGVSDPGDRYKLFGGL